MMLDFFKNGTVFHIFVEQINDNVRLGELDGGKYGTDENSIFWTLVSQYDSITNRSGLYNFDRNTLRLRFFRESGDVKEVQCNVFSSSEIFIQMVNLKKKDQKKCNDKIKDKKI